MRYKYQSGIYWIRTQCTPITIFSIWPVRSVLLTHTEKLLPIFSACYKQPVRCQYQLIHLQCKLYSVYRVQPSCQLIPARHGLPAPASCPPHHCPVLGLVVSLGTPKHHSMHPQGAHQASLKYDDRTLGPSRRELGPRPAPAALPTNQETHTHHVGAPCLR